MILLYRVLTMALYPFLFIFIYFRKIFKKEDPVRYKEKILISHFNVEKKISQLNDFGVIILNNKNSYINDINLIGVDDKQTPDNQYLNYL